MIVSIRGTHGSGKSSIVKSILKAYPHVPLIKEVKGKLKVRGYSVELPTGEELIVVGKYDTACGGCDSVKPYSDIWPLIDAPAALGLHVLFEGALVSSSYGEIGRSLEAYGDQVIFAFLDTPLDTCLARIAERRAARGNFAPMDPSSTSAKFDSVGRSVATIRDNFGRRVEILDHERATRRVLRYFNVEIQKELPL